MEISPDMLSRRHFVAGLGLLGVGFVATQHGFHPSTARTDLAGRSLWSAAATWPRGAPPGPREIAVIDRPVLLDRDVEVGGVVIEEGGALIFAADRTVTLTSRGNVVVRGSLVLRPAAARVVHTLRFIEVDERRFVGGGMAVLATDVGLWVEGMGQLDAVGTPKLPWTRAAGRVDRGASMVDAQATLAGWGPGDEIVLTPTLPPTAAESATAYDEAALVQASGKRLRLAKATRFEHPAVAGRYTAEILNLTRNVRIEGTPQGRAHIAFLHTHRPQTLRNVAIRHMGPRKATGESYRGGGQHRVVTRDVLGRYALHFHMCSSASVGSLIENVVVRDAGSHAFVTHESDGVTYRGCVSHNTIDDAYWWDLRAHTRDDHPPSNGVRYEHCVASMVGADPPHRGYRLAGFSIAEGDRNAVVGCVAVGVLGNKGASGFSWAEGADGVWEFRDCAAHNNADDGIFVWQNSKNRHIIERFVSYHNGHAGIEHGAYRNRYLYRDGFVYGNGTAGLVLHATALDRERLEFDHIDFDGAGISAFGLSLAKHTLPAQVPTLFTHCTFRGNMRAAVGATYEGANGASLPEQVDLVDCAFHANEFWLASKLLRDSVFRVQSPQGAYLVRPSSQSSGGELIGSWNARRTAAATFA